MANIKQAALAAELAISRGYLSELVGRTKQPSLELAFAIERATGGQVPAASWVTTPFRGAIPTVSDHPVPASPDSAPALAAPSASDLSTDQENEVSDAA